MTALAPVAWGTTYVVTTRLLPAGHPLFAGLLRALPAGLLALVITRTLPRGVWWLRAAVLGVLNIGLFNALLFAVLAVTVLREPLSAWRLGGGLVGATGVGLVVLGPRAALDLAGVAAGLGCAVAMALGLTLVKRWGLPAGVGPTAFAGWQLTAGGLFLVPVTFLAEGAPPHVSGHAALGYLWLGSVGGLIAYALWFRGVGTLPITAVAVLVLLSPLVAAVLGAVVLGQVFGPLQFVGFALSLASIAAAQLPEPGRERRAAEPRPVRETADTPSNP